MIATVMIPARLGSKRFPRKMLTDIAGKPLIVRTWEQACKSKLPVYVVTPDAEIAELVHSSGGNVIMTSADCRNGTERCADANQVINADLVINWQGDSPLLDPQWATMLCHHMGRNLDALCGTIGCLCLPHMGMVSVETDKKGRAVSFSRSQASDEHCEIMHVGIYAYWASSLRYYVSLPETDDEYRQSMEQLRWPADAITVCRQPVPFNPVHEVNVPEDSQIVADLLRRRDAAVR